MIRNRVILKSVALFLVLETIFNITFPTLSWALTSGPSAPEASSFEPVDTSEMVDLKTGDMVYNLPLLEVPGPGGSYPVSIAYHAGITPAEDASWVGLGWNINTGSIQRAASGYPDDWRSVSSLVNESWVGGTTDRVTMGLSASWWGVTLSGGIIQTNDTYRGSGSGGFTGAGFGYSFGNGFSVGGNIGATRDPVGGSSISVGDQAAYSGSRAAVGLGTTTTMSMGGYSSGLGGGVSARFGHGNSPMTSGSISLLGASIGSDGTTSVSVAGIGLTGSHLNKSGNVTVEPPKSNLSSFQDGLLHLISPVFDYSDNATRYYIKESQSDVVNGALYPIPSSETSESYFDTHDHDVYDMFEASSPDNPSSLINTPKFGIGNEVMQGGTLPATDNYIVMGQGTGGQIKPYDLVGTLYRKNKKNKFGKYLTKQYTGTQGALPANGFQPEFMFVNEFSNTFQYDESGSGEYFGSGSGPLSLTFNENKVTTDPAFSGTKTAFNKLGRASNVVWYTNEALLASGDSGPVKKPNAKGFDRREKSASQIGAFKITNPSGVTYHYALPVYSSDEEYYTENTAHDQTKNGFFKTTVNRTEGYAYAWYLTAVTGPDYVDRTSDGLTKDDWGYWIEFEYGKWTEEYKWRTPETGFVEDLDGNFRNYSRGKKELYYLNAIRSATHTALFMKDVRRDGRGLANNGRDASFAAASPCSTRPASTLKLTEIVLIENDHLPAIGYPYSNSYTGPETCTSAVDVHLGQNVLLSEGITADEMTALKQYSLKRIALETDDTQMMPNTTNSFDDSQIYTPGHASVKYGKLELKAITVFGHGAESLIPPIRFDYKDKTTPYAKDNIDYWGYYKSDYNSSIKDVNISKMPTAESAQHVDTWSLNRIYTSLGAEIQIDYESDDYSKSVLHNKVNFPMTNMETTGNGQYKIYMSDLAGQMSRYFSAGDTVSSLAVISEAKKETLFFTRIVAGFPVGQCAPVTHFMLKNVEPYYNTNALVTQVGHDYLMIQASQGAVSPRVPDQTDTGVSTQNLDDISFDNTIMAIDCNPDHSPVTNCAPKEARIETYRDFIGGEIIAEMRSNVGGGLRVREIRVIEKLSDATLATAYDYRKPQTSLTSGVTSYVPFKSNQFTLKYPERYKNSVDGFWARGSGNDTESLCTGGPIAVLIKDFQKTIRSVLMGATVERLFDHYDMNELPDREDMSQFLGALLNSRDDLIRYKRSELMSELLSKVNEAPVANVMYEYVTVRSKVISDGEAREAPSYAVNQYSVYDESMVSIKSTHPKEIADYDRNTTGFRKLMKRGVTINNFGNAVGLVKSAQIYASSGALLHEKKYHYLHELNNSSNDLLDNYMSKLAPYNAQGVLDETFVNARYVPYDHAFVDEENEDDKLEEHEVFYHDLLGVVTKRRNLPVMLLSVEDKDYKTGISSVSKNLSFDFYTGAITSTSSHDGYGNAYVTEVTPAFRKYSGMNLSSPNGKHMLSQEAARYSYQVDPANYNTKLAMVSASVQTWSDGISTLRPGQMPSEATTQPGIWRMRASYNYIGDPNTEATGDGLFPITNNAGPEFTAWTGSSVAPAGWIRNSEITLYDVNSHGIEATDINELYAATMMSYDQSRVLATSANAKRSEIAYSGIEETPVSGYYAGKVGIGQGTADVLAHTGKSSLKIGGSKTGLTINLATTSARPKFHVSAWVHKTNISNVRFYFQFAEGGVPVPQDPQYIQFTADESKKAGDWYLFEGDFNVPASATLKNYALSGEWRNVGSAPVWIDDFRIHPVNAPMVSYVYNDWSQVSHVLDANNIFTRYDYDEMGRLKEVYKETFKNGTVKTTKSIYHYANQND